MGEVDRVEYIFSLWGKSRVDKIKSCIELSKAIWNSRKITENYVESHDVPVKQTKLYYDVQQFKKYKKTIPIVVDVRTVPLCVAQGSQHWAQEEGNAISV